LAETGVSMMIMVRRMKY